MLDLTDPAADEPGAPIRRAARARRPRCWCGCPEAGHLPPQRHQRRSCRRCGPGSCPTYVPCSESGARVTVAHHVARAFSDMQVRHALDALGPLARDAHGADGSTPRIPSQRRPGTLRRADL